MHLIFVLTITISSAFAAYPVQKRPDLTSGQKLENFGYLYGAQWAYYLTGQRSAIETDGSFENWRHNIFSPHFDRDNFDYNIFKHTLTGNIYYLWYRSRGMEKKDAFLWSFLSSLAFEFTIETATERPSYQDIYQTPVFGTVLGIGVEKLSRYFHNWDTWYGHTLGYLLDPFALIPQQKENKLTLTPIRSGVLITYRF